MIKFIVVTGSVNNLPFSINVDKIEMIIGSQELSTGAQIFVTGHDYAYQVKESFYTLCTYLGVQYVEYTRDQKYEDKH